MAVMIGTGPHKGSRTAVAVGAAGEPLGKLRVRACPDRAGKLVAWARAWPERTWAVEGARGLGRLLARQLVAAGERVLDVQPKLAARVRLLEAGDTNKTGPDDARSVAVAALRSKGRQEVTADGHAVVLKKKLAAAVTASGTSLTEVSGVGPVIAATVIGDVITVARFPSRDHFAACNGTAPAGVSSGQRKIHRLSLRGDRRLSHAVHMAAINWIRHKHSDGRACCQRKLAEGKTRKEALRCLRRRISDAIYARLRADARKAGPGGQPGNDTGSSVTGSHPGHRLFGQATSGPEPSLRAPATFTQATPAPEPSAKKIQRAT